MAAIVYGTDLYKRCVGNITGLVTLGYTASASVDVSNTTNGCGDIINTITNNQRTEHSWEGLLTGGTGGVSGIALEEVGDSMATTYTDLWQKNVSATTGTMIVLTAEYTESENAYASFRLTAEKRVGV